MAARGSTVMQFVPSEVYQSATPPENPVLGQLWRNSGVTPNELLAWNGKGASNARSYAASKSGAAVAIEDLSDNRALGVTVKAVAQQAGSGTPSPSNVRAISGKASVKITRSGANILNLAGYSSKYAFMSVGNDEIGFINPTGASAITYSGLLKDGLTYTLSAKLNASAAFGVKADLYPDTYQELLSLTAEQTGNVTFTVPAGFEAAGGLLRFYVTGAATGGAALSQIQLVVGSVLPTYKAYAGVDYTLTPSATLYGLTGQEDEKGNDGHETHKTRLLTLNGSESWSYYAGAQPTLTTLARFILTMPEWAYASPGICSHFPVAPSPSSGIAVETVTSHPSSHEISIYILKSRISGWSDALTEAQKRDLFKTWLGPNNVQLVHQLTTPTTATVAPVQINGVDGTNVVTSDGASVTVAYTGSGWDTVGAVQRVAVEAVKISPEEGLRVDTVLTSADGAHQVSTFFNARGARYGLFRTSDGMLILGGMVLPNGQPTGVAGALIAPGSTGDTRIGIETASEGSGGARVDTASLHLVQPSFSGATSANPSPTGEKTPIRFETVRSTLLDGQSNWVDNYSAAVKALNSMRMVVLSDGGDELAWLMVHRSAEGSTILTDGAFAASDKARTLSNFAPMIHMSMPASESITYNTTARRYMPDWGTIEDDFGRYATFKGGNQSLRDVGIVIPMSGYYRFIFHAELSQPSASSGATLYISRMPSDWTPPTNRDYCLDTDMTTRIAYRRASNGPLNATATTCMIAADMWCFGGEKILPSVTMEAASKTLVSAGTFFTAQKIG